MLTSLLKGQFNKTLLVTVLWHTWYSLVPAYYLHTVLSQWWDLLIKLKSLLKNLLGLNIGALMCALFIAYDLAHWLSLAKFFTSEVSKSVMNYGFVIVIFVTSSLEIVNLWILGEPKCRWLWRQPHLSEGGWLGSVQQDQGRIRKDWFGGLSRSLCSPSQAGHGSLHGNGIVVQVRKAGTLEFE